MPWKFNPFTSTLDYYTTGVGGTISVKDEGTLLASDVATLNFVGVDVTAALTAAGEVTVFIPPVILAPYLDAVTVNWTASQTGNVSNPDGDYTVTPYSAGDSASCNNTNTITGVTAERIRDWNTGSYCELWVGGVLRDTLTMTGGGTPTTSPGGFISISSVQINGLGQYEAILSVTVDLLNWIAPNSGCAIEIRHYTTTAGLKTKTATRFYDNFATAPTITLLTVAPNMPVDKYVSGIKYYGDNSTFNINVNGLHAFNRTYKTYPMDINPQNFGVSFYQVMYNALGAGDPPIYDAGSVYSGLITSVNDAFSENGLIQARQTDIWSTPSYTTLTTPPYWLINTYALPSDDKKEYFRDEDYRLPPAAYNSIPGAITGLWDSTQNINVYQDGLGLQLRANGLDYPDTNYSVNYNPAGNPDYSTLAGNRTYFRALRDSGNPHSSLILRLTGLTYAEIQEAGPSQKWRIELKLPSKTGWLNCGKYYEAGTFTGADGDGILSSYSGSDFTLTFGSFTTADSGYMVIMRLTSLNTTITALTYLEAVSWA